MESGLNDLSDLAHFDILIDFECGSSIEQVLSQLDVIFTEAFFCQFFDDLR